MARKKKPKVFVSYSRHDEALVRPLAGLLGVASSGVVFMDVASLQPGDHWEKEILEAVQQASVFVLCWCCECEKSDFVAREIGTALSDPAKKLVPVLLCSTALPAKLSQWQWLDLRGQIVHRCDHVHHASVEDDKVDRSDRQPSQAPVQPWAPPMRAAPPVPAPLALPTERPVAARRRWGIRRALATGLAAVICVALLGVWTMSRTAAPAPEMAPPLAPAPAEPGPPDQPSSGQSNPGQPDQTQSAPPLSTPDDGSTNPNVRNEKGLLVERVGPILVVVGIIVVALATFLVFRQRSPNRKKPKEREAEVLSTHVRRYFEGLGREGQR